VSQQAAWKFLLAIGLMATPAMFIGCGAGSSVSGNVTAEGQPVTGGSVTLLPVATKGAEAEGAPIAAPVNSDGTFSIPEKTVAGKHKVMYSPPSVEEPEWDGYGTPPKKPTIPYAGMSPKETEVDITGGSNQLTIELVPGK